MEMLYYCLFPIVFSLAAASVVENESILQRVLSEVKELRDNQQECHAKLAEFETLRHNHLELQAQLADFDESRQKQRELIAKLAEFEKVKTRVDELEEVVARMSKAEAANLGEKQADKEKDDEHQLGHRVETQSQEIEDDDNGIDGTNNKEVDGNRHRTDDTNGKDVLTNTDNSSLSKIGIVRKRQTPGFQVAFSASVSVPDLVNLGAHHTIIFDRAITNVGNAYHPHTGIFIAPYHGVYVFHLEAMVSPGICQYLQIVLDGSNIAGIYPDASGNEGYETSGSIWVLEVNKGSEVWIRTGNAGQIHGNRYTRFSGWLLYATE